MYASEPRSFPDASLQETFGPVPDVALSPSVLQQDSWFTIPYRGKEIPNLRFLVKDARKNLEAIQLEETKLVNAIGYSERQLDELDEVTDPSRHAVPAVSLREIRFWVTLNTDAFHNRLRQAALSKESLGSFAESMPEIYDERNPIPAFSNLSKPPPRL
ncbi:hypothetical protein NCS52_00610400 [Fusarium sp. LHS14.1]|nr:hypothetical protein NCS52_00610400 [Fusarium sp. LHS14.1]